MYLLNNASRRRFKSREILQSVSSSQLERERATLSYSGCCNIASDTLKTFIMSANDSSLPPIEQHLVDELRQRAISSIEETGVENYHPADVERVKNDDYWLWRFIYHQRKDISWAFDMLNECIKWRKEFGVNDIKEREFPQFLDDIGAMYVSNKDKEGHRLVIMHVRRYRKEPIIAKLIRRYFVYFMEKLEKDDPYHKISIIFDMQGAGISNVDMDFLFFMFSCFKTYYPAGVAYILAFDMPWVFSAMWRIVKGWLSSGAVNKIKFVNKKTIHEFVDPDELLIEFGGNIPQSEKQIAAEKLSEDLMKISTAEAANYILSSEKKLEAEEDIEESLFVSAETVNNNEIINLLEVSSPLVEFLEDTAVISLTNLSSKNTILAFKIRTTSPEKFRVRPSQGLIRCGTPVKVVFTLLPGYLITPRDRFVVMGLDLGCERRALIDQQEMDERWKLCPKNKLVEVKLQCSKKTFNVEKDTCDQYDKPSNFVDCLLSEMVFLQRELLSLNKALYCIIFTQASLIFSLLYFSIVIL